MIDSGKQERTTDVEVLNGAADRDNFAHACDELEGRSTAQSLGA